MAKTFKVLSALLSYPTRELQAADEELKGALESEALLPEPCRKSIVRMIDEIATGDLYDLQERYVFLFDRTRSLSLHLFEHVHGEGRDRGQAMVDLMALYEANGLCIDARELPDYLPLFLEFLSTRPIEEARELLSQPLSVLVALRERLTKRRSVYANVFFALEALTKGKPAPADLAALLEEAEDDPEDLAALDKIWEDEVVTFGPGAAAGSACPMATDILKRMEEQQPGSRSGSESGPDGV